MYDIFIGYPGKSSNFVVLLWLLLRKITKQQGVFTASSTVTHYESQARQAPYSRHKPRRSVRCTRLRRRRR